MIDPAEGWIFHILPDSTGAGAIWAAQRIDDDKVGVVANMYTIREVNLTDTARFLGSKNLLTTAEVVLKAWKPADGLLDFTKVYSDGEYAHKFYSGRRMWGAYHLLAPSLELPSNYSDLKFDHVYPAAVVPDRKVSRDDVFAVHRSYYEGTEFDMTKGLAAGAWGNPDRFNSGTGDVAGNWERSLGLFRTSHTHLVQARSWLPDSQGGLLWYGPHSAPGSCFTPFSAGCLDVAEAYTIGNPNVLDRSSAYWAHRIVFNVMQIKYSYMRSDVNRTALALESQSSKLVAELDKMVLAAAAAGVGEGDIAANLTAQCKVIDTCPGLVVPTRPALSESSYEASPNLLMKRAARLTSSSSPPPLARHRQRQRGPGGVRRAPGQADRQVRRRLAQRRWLGRAGLP